MLQKRSENMDEKLRHKQFMLICARSRQGFFTNFFHILQYLKDAEIENRIPIIHWEGGIYSAHKKRYNGIRSNNIWDYFFEPVSLYKITDLVDKYEVSQWGPVEINVPNVKMVYDYRHISKPYEPPYCWSTKLYPPDLCLNNPSLEARKYVNDLINKYIRFKPYIIEKVNNYYNEFLKDKNILGIHIRGARELERDQGSNFFNNYVKHIEDYLDKYPDAVIYLATDHVKYLDLLKEKYGEKLYYRNHVRSNNEHAVQYGCKTKRKFNPGGAKVAEEVIVDVLLLTKSSFFLRGFSNVAAAVLFINTDLQSSCVCEYTEEDKKFLGIGGDEYLEQIKTKNR